MITFQGAAKRFPGAALPALYPVQLEVPSGTILGLVGRNGAGKSTLLRLAAGLLKPTEGRVLIEGHDVAVDGVAARASLGWVPESPRFEPSESPLGLLTHLAELDGHSRSEALRQAGSALAHVELGELKDRALRTLSQGQLRRLSLASAWLESPATLLYDEATNGLDPPGRRMLEASLRELRERGGSAILSTHRLDEVEAWCDRIAILKAGRLAAVVAGGAGAAHAARRLRIVMDRPPEARWPDLKGLGRLSVGAESVTLEATAVPDSDLMADLATRGYHIREVQSIREDVAMLLEPEPSP